MARIVLDGVSLRYGEREVLRAIDLELTERRIGVVGGNGSGKSTLARLLNGLVLPSEGRVLVDGLDTARSGPAVRRRVGFVFTDPDAQIVMPTVAEDVGFSLRRSGLDRAARGARVREALDRMGLAGHADHPAHLLSGGQKQLLALTAVLVTEPDVLVCDEPTTLLDARNARRVAALVDALPGAAGTVRPGPRHR
jgi:biotin transport system ATP-binding protein